MKHTYMVTGMTCNGCKASVEKHLNALPEISNAIVNLDKKEVVVEMSQHLPTNALQEVLPEKFLIKEKTETNVFSASTKEENKSILKQLYPLFLIFLFITGAAVLLNFKSKNLTGFMLDFMGLFYIVFSFFKFLDLKGFSSSFKMYDPLAGKISVYGLVYPFIELALGLFFLMRFQIPIALVITIIILGITTIGVTQTLINKKSIQCACLGSVLKLPMTKATFIENSIMIIMAIIMLISN